jgi:uncharacterized membrane protein YsdA (DUF1294 family)
MWWDKRRAKKEEWRVSEATLLIMSFIGGAIGILIGMFRFRHKTRKMAFQIIAALGLIASLIIYWFEFRAIVWFFFYIRHLTKNIWSPRRDLNSRPADYKSAAFAVSLGTQRNYSL